MPITVSESETPITENEIAHLELQLKITLPADYREFLLRHNGGHPDPDVFSFNDFSSTTNDTVSWFMCIKQDHVYDILETLSALQERIPHSFLPIAVDPFGNYICMAVSENANKGKIVLWDHELESEIDNTYFLANSFSEFVNSLHMFEE